MIRKALKWGGIALAVFAAWFVTSLIAGIVAWERVPVDLPPLSTVFAIGDTYVVATGTWVIEGEKQAFPLQTTEIRCEWELGRCTSGTASVGFGNLLYVDVGFHKIISWEKSRIVFVDDAPSCVQYVYTIDLVTKSANGVRQKRPNAQSVLGDCAVYNQELHLSLKNGFKESYALRQASRPW